MKTGRQFPQLLEAIKDHKFNKADYVGSSARFRFAPESGYDTNMTMGARHGLGEAAIEKGVGLSRLAVQQICSKFKVPFQALAEPLYKNHPDLLTHLLNGLFEREPKKIMVRTLGDKVRAVLSDRYRILDNFDVAVSVIPIVQNILGDTWENCVRSCEVTQDRMYIKVVHPSLEAEVPIPEGLKMGEGHNFFVERVQAALTITNSEVGLGSLSLSPAIYTRRCTNYAQMTQDKFMQIHSGKAHKIEGHISEIYSEETRSLEDAATLSKVRDVAKAALDGTIFNKNVKLLTEARGDVIEGYINETVENLANDKGLTQDEADSVMERLLRGREFTRFGLHNAVTRAAEDIDNYDRASELEKIGGEIIEMKPSDWHVISKKAA